MFGILSGAQLQRNLGLSERGESPWVEYFCPHGGEFLRLLIVQLASSRAVGTR